MFTQSRIYWMNLYNTRSDPWSNKCQIHGFGLLCRCKRCNLVRMGSWCHITNFTNHNNNNNEHKILVRRLPPLLRYLEILLNSKQSVSIPLQVNVVRNNQQNIARLGGNKNFGSYSNTCPIKWSVVSYQVWLFTK